MPERSVLQHAPHGLHLIAGNRVEGIEQRQSDPAEGRGQLFWTPTPALAAMAAEAASQAFPGVARISLAARAALFEALAEAIESATASLCDLVSRETGMPAGRVEADRSRACLQLRLQARHLLEADPLEIRHDPAMPERTPLPHQELWRAHRPIGPVAVFAAMHLPFSGGVIGHDSVAALAAGCPVVVKAHSAHPASSEMLAELVVSTIARLGLPAGLFSLLQGGDHPAAEALVSHPAIRAIAFTGSLATARHLHDLCAARPQPVPFHGEMGAHNPMFILPAALEARAEGIGFGWAGALTMAAGQSGTNPGLAFAPDGQGAERLITATAEALHGMAPQLMLSRRAAASCAAANARLQATPGLRPRLAPETGPRHASPGLFETDLATWLAHPELGQPIFGPTAVLVRLPDTACMPALARSLAGQHATSLHIAKEDGALAHEMLEALAERSGHVVVNGFATGAELGEASIQSGPWPASARVCDSSLGPLAMRRFQRPVAYQNLPDWLLPADIP